MGSSDTEESVVSQEATNEAQLSSSLKNAGPIFPAPRHSPGKDTKNSLKANRESSSASDSAVIRSKNSRTKGPSNTKKTRSAILTWITSPFIRAILVPLVALLLIGPLSQLVWMVCPFVIQINHANFNEALSRVSPSRAALLEVHGIGIVSSLGFGFSPDSLFDPDVIKFHLRRTWICSDAMLRAWWNGNSDEQPSILWDGTPVQLIDIEHVGWGRADPLLLLPMMPRESSSDGTMEKEALFVHPILSESRWSTDLWNERAPFSANTDNSFAALMIKFGADPHGQWKNQDGQQHLDLVIMGLNNEAPDEARREALIFAKDLLQSRADAGRLSEPIADTGMTVLHKAVSERHLPLVRYILSLDERHQEQQEQQRQERDKSEGGEKLNDHRRRLVNTPDSVGVTPLHLAAREVFATDIMEYRRWVQRPPPPLSELKILIPEGPNVSSLMNSSFGKKKDYLRVHSSLNRAFMKTLLDAGADIRASDYWGRSPLHAAVWAGSTAVVDAILEQAESQDSEDKLRELLDLNTDNRLGETALHIATAMGHVDIIMSLLQRGASPNTLDGFGRTPRDVAAAHGIVAEDIDEILAQKGGRLMKYAGVVGDVGESKGEKKSSATGRTTATNALMGDTHTPRCPGVPVVEADVARNLTYEQFNEYFRSLRRPVLLKGEFARHVKMAGGDIKDWTLAAMAQDKDFFATVEWELFYPHAWSNPDSRHLKHMTKVGDYIDYIKAWRAKQKVDREGAGEPAYLFDRATLTSEHPEMRSKLFFTPKYFGGGVSELYRRGVPEARDDQKHIVFKQWQWSNGPSGSGAHNHYHESAFNGLATGEKHWTLFRPADAFFGGLSGTAFSRSREADEWGALRCVQEAGDIFYLPYGWGHGIANRYGDFARPEDDSETFENMARAVELGGGEVETGVACVAIQHEHLDIDFVYTGREY